MITRSSLVLVERLHWKTSRSVSTSSSFSHYCEDLLVCQICYFIVGTAVVGFVLKQIHNANAGYQLCDLCSELSEACF